MSLKAILQIALGLLALVRSFVGKVHDTEQRQEGAREERERIETKQAERREQAQKIDADFARKSDAEIDREISAKGDFRD